MAGIINDMGTVEEGLDRFRPLAEQLIGEIMPVANMTSGGGGAVAFGCIAG